MAERILIIEDETELAEITATYLKMAGFETEIKGDGESGWNCFKEGKFHLVLLDIMLPKMNGVDVCKKIRECSNVPIIMLSAKSGEMDKVIALGTGADDYVTKPYSPLELVARVKAQLRRGKLILESEGENEKVLQFGRLCLDKESYLVTVDKETLDFTTKEFEILYYLAKHDGHVLTKEQIYEGVWQSELVDENAVTVYINRIREKLKKVGVSAVKTVWGVGYKFVQEKESGI